MDALNVVPIESFIATNPGPRATSKRPLPPSPLENDAELPTYLSKWLVGWLVG